MVDIKKHLNTFGNIIIVVGVAGGLMRLSMYDKENPIVCIVSSAIIIMCSAFVFIFCEWLRQMLENSEKQTKLLMLSNGIEPEKEVAKKEILEGLSEEEKLKQDIEDMEARIFSKKEKN